jgi:hypothetical protein
MKIESAIDYVSIRDVCYDSRWNHILIVLQNDAI